ncbi:MAG: hypothetical protein E1N59_1590 [Puniceicoccaceae bacterium 5H]|nr:MAG: hypothetical protein E1N59_1590 [Puniceicoccaceae bacterium 5H]
MLFAVGLWAMLTGVHLDVLQIVAWTRMLSENAQEMSMTDAVERTFAKEGMCSLCHALAETKEAERKDPLANERITRRELLCFQRLGYVVLPRPTETRMQRTEHETSMAGWRATPPTPPPRGWVA